MGHIPNKFINRFMGRKSTFVRVANGKTCQLLTEKGAESVSVPLAN